MKKLITTLFAMGAMALSSCAPTLYSADGAKTKLQAKEYSTEVLSYEEAKVRIIGLYKSQSFIQTTFDHMFEHEDWLSYYEWMSESNEDA